MIFYFSATGNTRWAAIQMAAATGEKLVYIPDAMTSKTVFDIAKDERLGFVFPVHGWRVPRLVRQFVSQMQVTVNGSSAQGAGAQTYVYAVCTAGDSVGQTMKYLKDAMSSNPCLANIGISAPHSTWSLIMPESYIGLPFMDVDTPKKESYKQMKAAEQLKEICHAVTERQKGIDKQTIGILPWLMSKVIGGFFEHVLITDRHFHVEPSRCTRCGICANVCPVHNIGGGHGHHPQWLHNGQCMTCFNCYHHCPNHAIEFGHQTQHKGQYYYGHKIKQKV